MTDDGAGRLLALLVAGAPRSELDAALEGADPRERTLALRLHEQLDRHRSREAELSALNETARELTTIRDLDAILAAIVRRARLLLGADMTYLSLNDEAEGASYMKVTDGALTQEFARLRLPLGTGLLGLVAQTGSAYFTDDYQSDERFLHADFVDSAVAGEQIRAILGVPLEVEGEVIGAILAVHRTVRTFPPGEVALLRSFAAHAAVALENARLFQQVADANGQLRRHASATDRAADAHDRLTEVLVSGGGVDEVATVLTDVLGGEVTVSSLADGDDPGLPPRAVADALATGRCVEVDGTPRQYVAVAAVGDEPLAVLTLTTATTLAEIERRTLERGALVTSLVLLFRRTEAEAEERVRGDLLVDLLTEPTGPGDVERLRERARLQAARLDGRVAVLVARTSAPNRQRALRTAAMWARAQLGLAAEHRGRVVVVVPSADPLAAAEALRTRLDPGGAEVTVGAAAGSWPGGVREAWREADGCVDAMLTLGRGGEVSDAAGLGVARLLLSDHGPAELAEYLERTIGPVLRYDAERGTSLAATLEAWFASGGSPRGAAERLRVHANTVTQRLARVDELLGDGWRSVDRSLDVRLALLVARLRQV